MMSWLQRQLASAGYYLSRDAEHRKDIARVESKIREIEQTLGVINALELSNRQIALAQDARRILADVEARTPENIVLKGYKVFSQGDEDGIIAAIFAVLGGQKTFIEIACGDGLENNTRLLLLDAWKGVWVDGSQDHVARIDSMLGGLCFRRLLVERQFVNIDNICSLIQRYQSFLNQPEIDFLSLDIDGNDLHVLLRSLEVFAPRVICVEYNGKFPPPLVLTSQYDAAHAWAHDDYYGASLMALVRALTPRYTLLTCTISGVNAFFVRSDLACRFRIYPPELLYQPARHHRLGQSVGHPSSSRWLKDILANDEMRFDRGEPHRAVPSAPRES
jgi:hypothetical protein